GVTCAFDASGSASNVAIASYHWWWDDETTSDPPTATVQHTYTFAAIFNVSLTVTDSSGNSATVTHSVSAVSTAAGPSAAFVFGCKGRTCTFDGSGSASSIPIVRYHWWWDDETTTDLTGATAKHVYGFGGTFSVTLTVTDANNRTASVTHAVTTQ
ncbi:MAG TPA: PKD domain-containing protein, partial [Acidimicrobiia bacterium]|nr:PKD domain-containing protein [Acidimicrobiia bacterium]